MPPIVGPNVSVVFPPLDPEPHLRPNPKLWGETPSLITAGSVKVSPPLPLTLLHLELVFKPSGVTVRSTTPIRDPRRKMGTTAFGYLVAVAGAPPSLGRDSTKIVEINAAILSVYWTRLSAAALVNIGSSDAHPDLPQVGEGGQLLWLTLRVERVVR